MAQRLTRQNRTPWLRLPHLEDLNRRIVSAVIRQRSRPGANPHYVIAQAPPGVGKSEFLAHRVPTWYLATWPHEFTICLSHTMQLARRNARRVRDTLVQNEALLGVRLRADVKAAGLWFTTQGGGLFASGLSGGVSGWRARLMLIDDPIKKRSEVLSADRRQKIWDDFNDVVDTRLEDRAVVVLMMHRWHPDDIAGRLIASLREHGGATWEVASYPALCELPQREKDSNGKAIEHWPGGLPPGWSADDSGIIDPLGRRLGEALWPEKFPVGSFERIKGRAPHTWAALYQQRPSGGGGVLIDRAWFTIVDRAPLQSRPLARFWDWASTEADQAKRSEPDWTAGVKVSFFGGHFFVEHVVRGRWSAFGVEQIVRQTAEMDGRDCLQVLEQEPGASGKALVQRYIAKILRGYSCRAVPARQNKEVRAQGLAGAAEAGLVRVVRGDWNMAFLDELHDFPGGKFDDQVDAAAGAFNQLDVDDGEVAA